MSAELSELRARCADLESGIAAAAVRLHDALIAGADTADLRQFIAARRAELAEARTALNAAIAEAEAAEQQRVTDAGNSLAAASARRLMALLATLQPPASPVRQ